MATRSIPNARPSRDSEPAPTASPHVDPGYALIRAVPPCAATFVHNAIMDMLSGNLVGQHVSRRDR